MVSTNCSIFKGHNALKTLQNDYDRLIRDYMKMDAINFQQETLQELLVFQTIQVD
jgi:hypothetical protein